MRLLICTDVAARGIDIEGETTHVNNMCIYELIDFPGLPYVINMCLPDESEDYLHRVGRVGRAERMGLAISIVSAVREKVWYHSCSNKGKSCSNRNLKELGGCTIWNNEVVLLEKVEKRLHQPIPIIVSQDLELPDKLASEQIRYGLDVRREDDSAASFQCTSLHLQALGTAVRDLAMLETEAQNIFLHFANSFPV